MDECPGLVVNRKRLYLYLLNKIDIKELVESKTRKHSFGDKYYSSGYQKSKCTYYIIRNVMVIFIINIFRFFIWDTYKVIF